MTQSCRRAWSVPLADLDAAYVVFTPRPGLLRCLREDEDYAQAQGLNFQCPKCQTTSAPHGITVLFDLPSVPKMAKPEGRWKWLIRNPLPRVTLEQKITAGCGFFGYVSVGKVQYK